MKTREEEIREAAESYANGIAQDVSKAMYCREDFIAGAEWADRRRIAKAVEWLKENMLQDSIGYYLLIIEHFEQAMKRD